MALAFDEYGRPFIILREQESKSRLRGIDAQKAGEMEKGSLGEFHEDEFTKMILSWYLDGILNEDLYKNKVESIPLTFEAGLLEKAGHFKEASLLLLWYVFYSSLWGNGNRGWPVKEFAQKEELCNKVKLLANMESEVMYDFVCSELNITFDQHNSLPELKKDLYVSQKNSSLRGEILLIRKILDTHLQMNSSKYDWEDTLPVDIFKHCEEKMFQNRVSVTTLVFYWNLWKEHILNIFRSIESPENEEVLKPSGHADFCLYYFGVRKQSLNGSTVYLSLNKDADWIRNTDNKGLHRDDKCRRFDGRELVFAIRSYWQSELLSVGIKVLQTLEALHKSKSNGSAFHQSTSLLHTFEVSKFLLDFQCHNLTNPYKKRLQYFLGISLSYLDIVFPLDWRKSVDEALVSLRETDLSVNLLEEIILQTVDAKALERVIIICLCSSLSVAVYENLINKLKSKPQWESFVMKFRDGGLKDVSVAPILQRALEDNFRVPGSFLSPHSFGYLLDRLLLMQTITSENSYTTRSSFVGSLTHIHSGSTLSIGHSLNLSFLVETIHEYIEKSELCMVWIHKSKIDISYFPLFVLKMVMIMSLICLKITAYSPMLLDYLSSYNSIAYFLPKKFVSGLLRKREHQKLNLDPEVVAEAFSSIDDPLLIVRSKKSPKINAPCAIFVDLEKSKEEIMSILFPSKNTHEVHTSLNNVNTGTILDVSSSETLQNTNIMDLVELQLNWNVVEEISEVNKKKMALNKLSAATMIQSKVDINKGKLLIAFAAQISCISSEDARLVTYAIEQLKLLAFAFSTSRMDLKYSCVWKGVSGSIKGLQRNRQKIDNFVKRSVMIQASKVEQAGGEDSVVLENQSDCDSTQDGMKKGKDNSKGKKSKKRKGKKSKKSKGKKRWF